MKEGENNKKKSNGFRPRRPKSIDTDFRRKDRKRISRKNRHQSRGKLTMNDNDWICLRGQQTVLRLRCRCWNATRIELPDSWMEGRTYGQTTISLVVFNGKKPLKPKTHSKSQLRATGNAKWVTDKRPHAKAKKIFSSSLRQRRYVNVKSKIKIRIFNKFCFFLVKSSVL